MLDTTNCLESNYHKHFLTHQVGEIVKEISPERRRELAGEIRARASLMGVKDEEALKVALKKLEGGA